MVNSDKWKIYALVCPIENKIRYIGKSSNFKTRYRQHCQDFGNETYKKMWIQKLKNMSLIPILTILDTSNNEIEARIKENNEVIKNIETVYNIFMPGKNTPTVSDYRLTNNIKFDCEFDLKKSKTDKYNKIK
jgi:predicted GIY-YIG superfamily endonuclease